MTRKKIGQRGFADMILDGKSKGTVLDEIAKILDLKELSCLVDQDLQPKIPGPDKGGRPAYPSEAMLKVLLLQTMHDLSDERAQDAIPDRLSFRRFCGFSLDDDTPDNATICRFRAVLVDLNVDLLEIVNEQLDKHKMRLRKGTLVDATIIHANAKAPSGGQVSERDPDAGWTQKAGKFHFGYKAHVGMDQTSSLINKIKVTSADVHDGLAIYECLDEDDNKVYADKAYDKEETRTNLRQHRIMPRIMRRTYASQSDLRKKRIVALNKGYGKVRCGVEKFFGTIKRSFGAGTARYLGIAKNQLHMEMRAACYNLKRVVKMLEDNKKMQLRPT